MQLPAKVRKTEKNYFLGRLLQLKNDNNISLKRFVYRNSLLDGTVRSGHFAVMYYARVMIGFEKLYSRNRSRSHFRLYFASKTPNLYDTRYAVFSVLLWYAMFRYD